MSLPDLLLEEPEDPEWCQIHNAPRPCEHCAAKMAGWTFDEMMERR